MAVSLSDAIRQTFNELFYEYINEMADNLSFIMKRPLREANTDIAMSTNLHGYNFKAFDENILNEAHIDVSIDDEKTASVSWSLPEHAFKDMDEEKYNAFQTLVVDNGMKEYESHDWSDF